MRRRIIRLALAVIILGIVGFWAWAFSPWAPSGHPDKLSANDFPVAAAIFCEGIFPNGEWEKGKQITAIQTTQNRALLVREADLEMRRMVDGLSDLAETIIRDPGYSTADRQKDSELTDSWFVDWNSYLVDRDSWATKLERGEDTPFTITAVNGARTSDRIEVFAEVNKMEACAIPDFV